MRVDSLFVAKTKIFHFVAYSDDDDPQVCAECVSAISLGRSYGVIRNLIVLFEYPVYEAAVALFGAVIAELSDPKTWQQVAIRPFQYLAIIVKADYQSGSNFEDLHAALIACGFEEERRENQTIILECQLQGLTH